MFRSDYWVIAHATPTIVVNGCRLHLEPALGRVDSVLIDLAIAREQDLLVVGSHQRHGPQTHGAQPTGGHVSYAIGDKVLFVAQVGSSAAEGHIVEAGCHGYVKIVGTDEYFFRGWVNADTHVICKLTTTPKPKKLVTRPRVVKYDGTAFSLRNYDGREGVGVGGYLHASDDGGKRWFKVKLVPWNGPTDAFLGSDLPGEGFAEMANDLFQNPTETVEVDDE